MTGFARVRRLLGSGELIVSLKSVNHKGLDLHFHMPQAFDAYENPLRALVKAQVARGHVQVFVAFQGHARSSGSFDREMLSSWLEAFRKAAAEFGLENKPDLNTALRLPGMFQVAVSDTGPSASESDVIGAAAEALQILNDFRAREGTAIAAEILQRCAAISRCAAQVEGIRSQATRLFQKRLTERLAELLHGAGVEPQRLVQEAAILADRSDISEEVMRLKVHTAQVEHLLHLPGEKGKKLDFLLQEMNREANTILSKTGGLNEIGLKITELGLSAKAEIDKIREQSLNLE
jgi:uncharacterized protein (TIGR00255 family)